MKALIIFFMTMSAFANDSVLTSAIKENSGCDIGLHLGIRDKKDFLKFHFKLIALIKKGRKEEVANLISFPLRVSNKKVVKTKNEFIQKYDSIVNKKIKKIIVEQNQNKFFCKSTGVMYGRGEVWVNNFNKESELRVISIFAN